MSAWYLIGLKSVGTLVIGSLISFILASVIRKLLGKLAAKTISETDDFIVKALSNTIAPVGFVISAIIAWELIPANELIDKFAVGLSKLILVILVLRTTNRIVIRLIQRWSLRINDAAVGSMMKSLSPLVSASLWGIGLVFYLQNMGVQMAAIWALLSAGGIGAGLALKEPVQEFFEYVTILLDKPFQSGQFINVGSVWATVESVGVRSTRLRSLNGEIIVMSNSSLTNGIISNYTEMKHRRIVHKLGIVYDTPIARVRDIPKILNRIVNSTENAQFDRCHFTEFGSSSLDFELVYFIPTNNYTKAMEAQQEINLKIMSKFQELNINFAFPTRTLHIADT